MRLGLIIADINEIMKTIAPTSWGYDEWLG